MPSLAYLFPEPDRTRVNNEVATAEARAAIEIIPVVARESGRYDRSEDIVGLWVGVVALAVVWSLLPQEDPEHGSWGGGLPPWIQLAALLLALVIGFVLGTAVASRVAWMRRLFTPRQQMQEEVLGRARAVFFDNRVHHTSRSTGVLIYVSLLEHQAAILADQLIVEKVGQAALDDVCAQLTQRLKTASTTEALCDAIRLAGEKMAAALPRLEGQANELPNALVLIE